jgi:hypothetical protein
MVAKGNRSTPLHPEKWNLVSLLPVLGHEVQDDGGIMREWHHTKAKLWGAYWRNAGSSKIKAASTVWKARLLNQTVVPCFSWKVSRWPWQKTVAIALDALQVNMMAKILCVPRGDGEDIDHYCRRRNRLARDVSLKTGMWSRLWARRMTDWHNHLSRAATRLHFCSRLLQVNDAHWLLLQRSMYVSQDGLPYNQSRVSASGGRTGTRLNIGRPQTRWHEGVALAETILQNQGSSAWSGRALSIGTIIRGAMQQARDFVSATTLRPPDANMHTG